MSGSKSLDQLANCEHKLVYVWILESIEFIKQCSRCYKSEHKNIQVADRSIQILWNPIDQKLDLTDRKL